MTDHREVRDLAEPILLELPLHPRPNASMEPDDLACAWWDERAGGWRGDGCDLVELRADATVCACNHLTAFAALGQGLLLTFACANYGVRTGGRNVRFLRCNALLLRLQHLQHCIAQGRKHIVQN